MATEEIDANVLEGFAAKIDALDLTEQEGVVLRTVLARASSFDGDLDSDVAGFGGFGPVATTFTGSDEELSLTAAAAGWGRAMGFHLSIDPNRFIGETEKN